MLISFIRYARFRSVVVITSALHAEGHGFKPRSAYFFYSDVESRSSKVRAPEEAAAGPVFLFSSVIFWPRTVRLAD